MTSPGAGRMWAWRAHAYGGASELRLEAARLPPLRAPDRLLVRVAAAGLNPLDAAMLQGYGARALAALRPLAGSGAESGDFPLVCGREFAGEVERAGPGAPPALRRGARVWGVVPAHEAGALARYVVARAQCIAPAPAALSDLECGGAPFAALSASAAVRAAGRMRRALVLGLGGAGQAAVQLLAARGVDVVVGCAGDAAPRALELGAREAHDRHAPDYEARLAAGGPYCAVLDCAGLGGWGAARWGGARYVTLSSPLAREMDARGVCAGAAAAGAAFLAQNSSASVRWAFFAPNVSDLDELRRLADRGRYRVVLERVFPWWEGRAAVDRVAAGGARGKVVIDWERDSPHPLDRARTDSTAASTKRSNEAPATNS